MRLLFDENVSPRPARLLQDLYSGSSHVHLVGLGAAPDGQIWSFARENNFVIVTEDADFYHRALRLGHPPKIVWRRLGNCSTAQVEAMLGLHHGRLLAFQDDPD